MGELICVCRFASLVVCASCDFAKRHNPDKAWNEPRWDTKDQHENQSGLDDLADEILANLDQEDIEYLGLRVPVPSLTKEEEK